MEYLSLREKRNKTVGIVDLVSPNRSLAVNQQAARLVEKLDAIMEVATDYTPTQGFSTIVEEDASSRKLYEVKSVLQRGEHYVQITPLCQEAERYLRQIRD